LGYEELKMSIQKKSLISSLNATKKANVASSPLADATPGTTSVKTAKIAKMAKLAKFAKLAKLAKFAKI
jgi:hypothetical protein